ncbi:hypothetical protein [Streptomyces sp. NPDC006012]|uniref:hypothetical protein n=1 Tax=Streptomyces sp. NPDC006012 TaxID=3364739 RepID=UPI0036940099
MPNSKARKKALLEEFYKSGKSRKRFGSEKGVKLPTFSKWVTNSERYLVDPEIMKGRRRVSPSDITRILEEWLKDPLERTLADFGAAQSRPIPSPTIDRWGSGAEKYGVSQKEVDECKKVRKRKNPPKSYEDDQKKGYILGFLRQRDTVSGYALTVGVLPQNLAEWLRNAARYGLNQKLVDLAVQNRREAFRLGLQDSLEILPPGPPVAGRTEPPGLSGPAESPGAGPATACGGLNAAGSVAPYLQAYQPDFSSVPYAHSDAQDQYVRSVVAGQVLAYHHLPAVYGDFRAGLSHPENRPVNSFLRDPKGKPSHHR